MRGRLRQHIANLLGDRSRGAPPGLPAVWNVRESEDWATYFDVLGAGVCGRSRYGASAIPTASSSSPMRPGGAGSTLNSRHNFTVIHNGLDIERINARSSTRRPRRGPRQVENCRRRNWPWCCWAPCASARANWIWCAHSQSLRAEGGGTDASLHRRRSRRATTAPGCMPRQRLPGDRRGSPRHRAGDRRDPTTIFGRRYCGLHALASRAIRASPSRRWRSGCPSSPRRSSASRSR